MSKISTLILTISAATCVANVAMARVDTVSVAAGPATAATMTSAPAERTEDAAARTTFEINCSGCHELSDVTSVRKDVEGWTETVRKMVGYGAPVGVRDQEQIIRYLTETYPADNS